ncbi:MAG TPA: DUF2252 domain-containing protein [Solirubrobacterales bacterium]|nr:DUF2252 domain-containing protein [Solirubrobacterales bacterium]
MNGTIATFEDARKYGKTLRSQIKRSDHARFLAGERDPVAIIEEQNLSRLQELIPVRIGRMLQSKFAYYRGTAATMAHDLSDEPRTGIQIITCGDAHVANFGLFAAPDRRVLLDLNDFDESGPGPWEWDVKRLVASVEVGFRHRGFSAESARRACLSAARSYRETLAELAEMSALDRYYYRAEIETYQDLAANPEGAELIRKTVKKARKRTSERVLGKIVTTLDDGELQIADQPPILRHIGDLVPREEVQRVVDKYRETLRPDIALLLSKFRLVDYALRVVGVGSVGTRCFIILLVGPQGEPVFIQLKEAQRSVLETWGKIPPVPLTGLGDRDAKKQGYRVVSSQQVLQAASDPFLGWVSGVRGVDYYGRQFRDMKGSVDLETLTEAQFERYGTVCARLLARAHSQSPGWAAILGYLGGSDVFDRAVATWCHDYADQAERDFEALEAAVKSGRLPCEAGV